MASVKKLPSGKWNAVAYYKDPATGKVSRPSFTAPTKAEAVRMAAEWEASKERMKSPRDRTVADCIDRYIKSKEGAISPSTLREYRRMQRTRYSSIASLSISKLGEEDLQRYVSSLSNEVSPKSVANAYGLLISSVSMFSDRAYRVTLPAPRPAERHIPSDDDIRRLIEEASPDLRLSICLAAFGTLRLGEVAALTHGDVDKTACTVRIHADMVKGPDGWVVKENPKTTSSNRTVPLPAKVTDMIGDGEPAERIIKVLPCTIERAFIKLRDRLGLKCRFHDLRHYAASIMHALGIPDVYIMERGGWKSDTVLKSIYRNSLSDQSAKFQDKANNHFDSLL